MAIVFIIDILVAAILVGLALAKGVEHALPFVTFVLVLIPTASVIPIPGLFDLTTQRVVIATLTLLYLGLERGKPATPEAGAIPLRWLMALHIAWSLVAVAHSVVPVMSIKKMLSVVIEYYLLYLIFAKTIKNVGTVQRILSAMVGAVSVSSVFGAIEAYRQWSVMEWFPPVANRFGGGGGVDVEWGRGVRAASTFDHPILFGAALAMAIPLALYLTSVAQRGKRKFFLWVAILLTFMVIYKTMSRGPWLGVIIALALMFLLGQNRVRKYLLVVGLLTVSVLVIRPGVWDTVKDVYIESMDPESPMGASYEYRYALRDVVEKALATNWERSLWGYGPESFFFLKLEGEFKGKPHLFESCDSAWLELAIETGYVGLYIMAALLFKPAWVAWRDFWRLPKPGRYLSFVLFVNLVVYYFLMLSVAMYSWGQNGYMLWIVIALTMAYHRLSRLEPQLSEAKTMPVETEALVPVGAAGSYY